jgi:hypothetical protein
MRQLTKFVKKKNSPKKEFVFLDSYYRHIYRIVGHINFHWIEITKKKKGSY